MAVNRQPANMPVGNSPTFLPKKQPHVPSVGPSLRQPGFFELCKPATAFPRLRSSAYALQTSPKARRAIVSSRALGPPSKRHYATPKTVTPSLVLGEGHGRPNPSAPRHGPVTHPYRASSGVNVSHSDPGRQPRRPQTAKQLARSRRTSVSQPKRLVKRFFGSGRPSHARVQYRWTAWRGRQASPTPIYPL